jgi:S1-C subfamily serine protease
MSPTTLALFAALLVPALPVVAPKDPGPTPSPPGATSVPPYIQRVAPSVVGIRTQIPLDRPSVLTLGPLRSGSGVIFDPAGYVVTVGYILTDATRIQVSLRDGRTVPARLVGLDIESGIGVIKLEGDGPWPAAPLGNSTKVAVGDATGTIGVGSENDLVISQGSVNEIRSFAGYWEYMLDRSFIVAPYNPSFGGSPLVNTQGEVIGVTSLRLGETPQVNLAIPIEYFAAVRDELIKEGRVRSRRARPWIGIYTVPGEQGLIVAGASPVGPASEAGFERGDVIVRLNGERVENQEDFYRKLWRTEVGRELTIVVLRESRFQVITLRSIDRYQLLSAPGK